MHISNWIQAMQALIHIHQPFNSDDLISHRFYVLEALLVDKAIDQYESLSIFYVKVPHRRKLLGASSVKDLQNRWGGIHLNFLAVKILNGWVVLFNKRPGDKLDSEGGFPDPTAAEDHHFVLAHRSLVSGRIQEIVKSYYFPRDIELNYNIPAQMSFTICVPL